MESTILRKSLRFWVGSSDIRKDNGENIMKSSKKDHSDWERSQMLVLEELRVQVKTGYTKRTSTHSSSLYLDIKTFGENVEDDSGRLLQGTRLLLCMPGEWEQYWMRTVDVFFAGEQVQDHDTFVDHMNEYHEVHEMQNNVQHNYVVDSDADYTSDGNIIPYDQVVQSRLANKPDMVMNDSVTSELARYKELVGEYEKQAKFELTDRERKIDEQMRIIISDQNRKETSLKSELHSAQILLSSTS
ncbi:hypothetical protein Tco_0771082 [Tanacetum coccineum]|uniref:Uncharacterized protein n=1 Tax=Tanacetum coccineum TaxID=301880 RepID=A0ABQ4ZFD2_9ASTR